MRVLRLFNECKIINSYQNGKKKKSKLTYIILDYENKFGKYNYSGMNH